MRAFLSLLFLRVNPKGYFDSWKWWPFVINTLSETRIFDLHLRWQAFRTFPRRSLPRVSNICRLPCFTVQPKNNACTRTSFCVRKPATSCGFLRFTCAWILQDSKTSLRLEVNTARTSLRLSPLGFELPWSRRIGQHLPHCTTCSLYCVRWTYQLYIHVLKRWVVSTAGSNEFRVLWRCRAFWSGGDTIYSQTELLWWQCFSLVDLLRNCVI